MKRNGFTLIELAIALVIIGLLIGTVLKGRAMIEQAKVNRVASDVHGIVAAVDTFQNRYGYLPSDIPSTANITLKNVPTSCYPANSYGYIRNNKCAWQELISSGLVSGNINTGTGPSSPYGNPYTFGYGNGQSGTVSGTYIQSNYIPNTTVGELDRKYDDGIYNTGDIQDYQGKYPAQGGAVNGRTTMRWWAF